ncbi:MAG TPA: DUF1343 domain-containing protein [Arachidicoccus soli]|uniref:DUF1343 domain-containing protein n=1 Tax=Arachidicoccus soli TaxID=2341117 RepID=A0A386HSY2_9BACT|nr:DUF1343 domain-containing protein [Arachidicoccus soli]AYD48985.1 DUF1343 domain-containing protein [Arachidicoccus soli]HEU0226121.1 DUF1343 domain-containing protein [Arachidicoccus soli]
MRFPRITIITVFVFYLSSCSVSQRESKFHSTKSDLKIETGAEQFSEYLPLLKEKNVGLIVNQTSQVRGVLLPDTLLHLGVNVVKIFSPEHGFRGVADAGAAVNNDIDKATGIPIISLYGKNKRLSAKQLSNIDVIVYDLQDVGARFYTYISTLQEAMEACAANHVKLIILDRPNPLGFMVDGPVLQPNERSSVGRQTIPIVYGMTAAEYAEMLVGENWITNKPEMTVIKCKNYSHNALYQLPVSPSPNLKNMAAVYLYPSLCLFEGTNISLGRGTNMPFQQFGAPSLKGAFSYSFEPKSMIGASDPPLLNQICYGQLIAKSPSQAFKQMDKKLQLKWIITAYKNFPEKDKFFNNYFNKLAGTDLLKKQIEQGISIKQIRYSWQPALDSFKVIRKKYLLYK